MGVKRVPVVEPAKDERASESAMPARFSYPSAPETVWVVSPANTTSAATHTSILRSRTSELPSLTLFALTSHRATSSLLRKLKRFKYESTPGFHGLAHGNFDFATVTLSGVFSFQASFDSVALSVGVGKLGGALITKEN